MGAPGSWLLIFSQYEHLKWALSSHSCRVTPLAYPGPKGAGAMFQTLEHLL